MAVEFPQDPQTGDSFESGGVIYSWDGRKWVSAFQPNINYTGPRGPQGATGPQGPTDAVELTVTSDLDENRPLIFASDTAGTGTIPLQTEPGIVYVNPAKNELYGQNLFAPLSSSASQFPLLPRNVENTNQVEFGRISTIDGFYLDFETTSLNEIYPVVGFPIASFARIRVRIAVVTDSSGSLFEEIVAYNNYDGTAILFNADGTAKSPNTFGSVAPSGGNPSYSIATILNGSGGLEFSIYSLVDATITGKAHIVLDFMDTVTL